MNKYLFKNANCLRSANKKFKVHVSDDLSALDFSKSWEGCETMDELAQGVFNYAALEQVVRPHSHAGLALLRGLHEIRWGSGLFQSEKEQKKEMVALVNDVIAKNATQVRTKA